MPRPLRALVLLLFVLVSACVAPSSSCAAGEGTACPVPQGTPLVLPPPVAARIGPDDLYPNIALTPGAVDVRIADNNVQTTICVSGYTATVRSVNDAEKRLVAARYGYTGASSQVEYDHLISLELGGSNDAANLWPELYITADAGGIGARQKDQTEDSLHRAVCSGQMPLRAAQDIIRTDWYRYWLEHVRKG